MTIAKSLATRHNYCTTAVAKRQVHMSRKRTVVTSQQGSKHMTSQTSQNKTKRHNTDKTKQNKPKLNKTKWNKTATPPGLWRTEETSPFRRPPPSGVLHRSYQGISRFPSNKTVLCWSLYCTWYYSSTVYIIYHLTSRKKKAYVAAFVKEITPGSYIFY